MTVRGAGMRVKGVWNDVARGVCPALWFPAYAGMTVREGDGAGLLKARTNQPWCDE